MELVQPPNAAPCPVVVLDTAANPVVVLTQVRMSFASFVVSCLSPEVASLVQDDESHDASASKINWTRARDIALLGQIAKKGKVAFETKRGGAKTKDGTKIPTQEQVCVDVSTPCLRTYLLSTLPSHRFGPAPMESFPCSRPSTVSSSRASSGPPPSL